MGEKKNHKISKLRDYGGEIILDMIQLEIIFDACFFFFEIVCSL